MARRVGLERAWKTWFRSCSTMWLSVAGSGLSFNPWVECGLAPASGSGWGSATIAQLMVMRSIRPRREVACSRAGSEGGGGDGRGKVAGLSSSSGWPPKQLGHLCRGFG